MILDGIEAPNVQSEIKILITLEARSQGVWGAKRSTFSFKVDQNEVLVGGLKSTFWESAPPQN